MKKIVLISFAILCMVCACRDPFSLMPLVPREDGGDARSALNITVTHGGKRFIELNWDAISGAVRYHIARANTPLETFVQCGETTDNGFRFTVAPGTTAYYRIKALFADGRESEWSPYVMGSSLAQPFITDVTEITESSATVTWYMDNVSGATYKAGLRYIAYCFNQATGAEVAQFALDGSQLTENKARFTGLFADTKYAYQMEAFLVSDQSNSEKSDIVDRETAIRSKPGAPINFKAAQGISTHEIVLSFELPEPVKIKNGDIYEPHDLFFEIAKRVYREGGNDDYTPICAYLGATDATDEAARHTASKGSSAVFFDGKYETGKTVTWVDGPVSGDYTYEYRVKAYVDGTTKNLSSDESNAGATGWALAPGTLSVGTPVYTPNEDGTENIGARLPLVFTFDPRGVEYRYKVLETINPIEDAHEFNPSGKIRRESGFLTYAEVSGYTAVMDLTRQTTEYSPGRGLYSYEVMICLPDETPVATIETLGEKEISEDVTPIVVEGFSVLDGFTDKFRLTWKNEPNVKYELLESADGKEWETIGVYNALPGDDYVTDIGGYEEGVTKYFALQPTMVDGTIQRKGQRFYHPAASKTLGKPRIAPGGNGQSYSAVTVTWIGAQKADTYRIKYWYTKDGAQSPIIAGTVRASDLSVDVTGQYKYTFSPFAGNVVDVSKAGNEIQIAVDALNEGLRAAVGGEIITTSAEEVKIRLVGPALLNLSASKAASAEEITVSWNRISGADGYYVFRRQFNMAGTAEEGTEAVVYYVPASQSAAIAVTGKNLALDSNAKVDTLTVKAAASFNGSTYFLHDQYLPDSEYNSIFTRHTSAYREQQSNLVQGYPYRYYVVPVVNRGGVPESLNAIEFAYGKDGSNKNTGITAYTIRENGVDIRFSGAADLEQEGFAIGFGQNVTATKGSYASFGNANDGIKVTWGPPSRLSAVGGFSPRYTVYRKKHDETEWMELQSTAGVSYTDIPPIQGVVYEYTVGIANGNNSTPPLQPQNFPRYIEACRTQYKDDNDRPDMIGFMLTPVVMDSASRDERTDEGGNFAELVQWYSAGIENPFSTDSNWGIDGYMLWVMNRSIDGSWHEIAEVEITDDILDQADFNALVTNSAGLLKVLRDYRHYFKVCSYVLLPNGEKMYGPEHSTVWSESFNDNNNPYVKWGARQISVNEFAALTSLSIGTGMYGRGTYNVTITTGTSRTITFSNSRPHVVTVSGVISAYSQLNKKAPSHYGATASSSLIPALGAKDQQSTLTITGPADVGMYSGIVRITGLKSDAGTGPYRVDYNGQNNVAVESRHYLECFTFYPTGILDAVTSDPDYKSTADMDWNPDTGW
jgi:hypothetical protein